MPSSPGAYSAEPSSTHYSCHYTKASRKSQCVSTIFYLCVSILSTAASSDIRSIRLAIVRAAMHYQAWLSVTTRQVTSVRATIAALQVGPATTWCPAIDWADEVVEATITVRARPPRGPAGRSSPRAGSRVAWSSVASGFRSAPSSASTT